VDETTAKWSVSGVTPFRRLCWRAPAELAGSSIVVAREPIEGADMDRNAMVWIIVAIVAIVVIALVAWTVRKSRRRAEAERLRGEIGQRSEHLEKRESVAAETEARARAAQAEAEAKAAEAARLQNTAQSHRDAVNTTREELDAHRERVDQLDPKGSTAEPAPGKTDQVHETRADTNAPQQRPSSQENMRP
jgi:FtsZ-interacting cell division protein ZipA